MSGKGTGRSEAGMCLPGIPRSAVFLKSLHLEVETLMHFSTVLI